MNFLSVDDRQGKIAELKHTIEGLYWVDNNIAKIPMIITDHQGKIQDQGPYYMEDRQIGFKENLKPGQTFFIIFNHFTGDKITDSHMIAGYFRSDGETFELFDPNGKLNNEGIYLYFRDMYQSVIDFLPKHKRVELYTGSPVICPMTINNPCIFRSIFFILFRPHLASFQETIQVVRTLVNNPTVVNSLVNVVRHIHSTHKQGVLVEFLPQVKTEFATMLTFGHQYINRTPVNISII